MKTAISFFCLFAFLIAFGCDKDNATDNLNPDVQGNDTVLDRNLYYSQEIFQDKYLGIYDKWRLDETSGGYAGGGYDADFDQLVIESFGIFKFFRHDSLLVYGRIEVKEQNDSILRIVFIKGSAFCRMKFFDMDKYVNFHDNSMLLVAPCCDRYNYCFTKCSAYSVSKFYQESPDLDCVSVTRITLPDGKSLRSVYFTDRANGYVLRTDNTILKTQNGGTSWSVSNTGTDIGLYTLYFMDDKTGFVVGGESSCSGTGCVPRGSIILKTVNGGTTWLKMVTPAKGEIYSIVFADDLNGFAAGEGLLAKTNDGGATWEEFTLDISGTIEKIFFLDSKIGFMCGLFNNLFKTTDGGNSWINLTSQNGETIWHFKIMQFTDENTGFFGTYNCGLLKTTDGGLAIYEIPDSPDRITGLFFSDEDNGIVFGKKTYSIGNCNVWESTVHITSDGGMIWQGDHKVGGGIGQVCSPEKNIFYGMAEREIIRVEIK
jgi:photosystem II stability/assembly factor-like uncharacterized protein